MPVSSFINCHVILVSMIIFVKCFMSIAPTHEATSYITLSIKPELMETIEGVLHNERYWASRVDSENKCI